MTATHAVTEEAAATDHRPSPAAEAAEPQTPPSEVFFAGNPAAVGLPVFVAGTVALALVLVGYVPVGGLGASIPVISTATGFGLAFATVWAAALGQTAVASIFAIFSGFWLSYAALVLGLTHNWFAITPNAALHTQSAFLITWLVIIGMLTLATLRLPFAFTLLFALIDLTLVFVLISTLNASDSMSKAAGVVAFVFAAVGVYLFMGVASVATGGKPLALGAPVLH